MTEYLSYSYYHSHPQVHWQVNLNMLESILDLCQHNFSCLEHKHCLGAYLNKREPMPSKEVTPTIYIPHSSGVVHTDHQYQ